MSKNKKSEQGSALVLTIVVIAILSIVVSATTSSMIRNYSSKKETLSSEQTEYINNSCVEYTKSYLTKLINTSFTYILYNDHTSPSTEAPFIDSASFDGAIVKYDPPADEYSNPYRRPRSTDSKYHDSTDPSYGKFDEDFSAWYNSMEQFALDTYEEYMRYKFDTGTYSTKCTSHLRKDIADSLLAMRKDSNEAFNPTSGDEKVADISARIISSEDDFIKGNLSIEFTTTLTNGKTIVQKAKYKWNALGLIKEACHEYATGSCFTSGVEIKAYYD
jgi:type II secretory pathway pseudopilin PulG